MMIRSVDLRQKEKQLLDKVLGPDVYDRRIRPGIGNITSGKPYRKIRSSFSPSRPFLPSTCRDKKSFVLLSRNKSPEDLIGGHLYLRHLSKIQKPR